MSSSAATPSRSDAAARIDPRVVETAITSPVSARLLDDARTLTTAVAELAERYGGWRWGLVLDRQHDEHPVRLGDLWARAGDVATALVAGGVCRGDVVLLVAPTSPDLLGAYVGVLRAGGVPALLAAPGNRFADWEVYQHRIGAVVTHARARALYTTPDVASAFARAPELLRGVMVLTPDTVPPAPAPPPVHTVDPDELVTLQYSSGSTGSPKGVRWRHRELLAHLRAVRTALALGPRDVSVNWIPLYHDMGLVGAFLLPLLVGMPAVLLPTMDFMREPELWLWAIRRYGGTISWAPNFAYAYCAARLPEDVLVGLDLSTWRIAVNASEPVLTPTIRHFTDRFAPYRFRPETMTPAWGLAETVTIATTDPPEGSPRIETIDRQVLATSGMAAPIEGTGISCVGLGRPVPGASLEIRDAAGHALPARHVGTIWVRSDCLFAGYHHDPEATARTVVDGWLDTGDQGYVADGDLFFVAREKDLIVIGGDKYAPHDIEAIVGGVPGVRQGCAVAFGVIDEEQGTEHLAIVAETHLDDPGARATLAQGIRTAVTAATGLGVRHLLLVGVGGVEKTSSGKLARRATRARHADALGIVT